MITIYDHNTHPIWADIYRSRHESRNRTNGGYTYSCDIVKYHIPHIVPLLKKNTLITTVGMLTEKIVPKDTELIIYYMHENSEREFSNINNIVSWYKGNIIFITSRYSVERELKRLKLNVVHIPMSIDISALADFTKSEKYNDKRVIYFGNKYLGKSGHFEQTKSTFIKNGWVFDEICYNKFNGINSLNKKEMFDILSKYRYGIAEGRCFLELNALGVKTLICASACQGIITNDIEFELHKLTNFADGKVWTFSKSIQECIDNFDKAIIKTVDVSEILPILEKGIMEIIYAND